MKTIKCSKCEKELQKNFLAFKCHMEKHGINTQGTEYALIKELWETAKASN